MKEPPFDDLWLVYNQAVKEAPPHPRASDFYLPRGWTRFQVKQIWRAIESVQDWLIENEPHRNPHAPR